MNNDFYTEFVKSALEMSNYTDFSSMRLYHQVYPEMKELRFDTLRLEDPMSMGFIPTSVANLTVDDAKQMIGILQLFIAAVE